MSAFWLNGRRVDEREGAIAIGDRGFTLGDGLFETMRAYDGHLFRLDAHLARLAAGAERIGMTLPGGLAEALRETVAASGLASASARLTVSRGVGGQGLAPPEDARPTCAIAVRPYSPAEADHRQGTRAVIASGRLNEHAAGAGLKSLGYLEAVLAQREALAAGARDALLLDTAGHLAEGAASNLFLVREGALLTPPTACGILPGITRATVLELARAEGIEVYERPLAPESLREAQEAFLTSSLRELVPLTRVDGRAIGTGRPGSVTLRLLGAYRQRVRDEADRERERSSTTS